MNAIDGATYGLTVQFGRMNGYEPQNGYTSNTGQTQEPDSFLSILNLLDVDGNGQIDTQEMKFGAGFTINKMFSDKDLNGDLSLSPEEAGLSPSAFTQLDTDGNQLLSAQEIISPANGIIDGLVPILDTSGDGALSREELAIFEILFNGKSSLSAAQTYQPAAANAGVFDQLVNMVSLKA
ncbi:MAG: EF-hand domain-containing protein [Deltaproteobacteria bacterium]|nr:EF-hand domain-containing protein [Deltaproteobacteria bacterium]